MAAGHSAQFTPRRLPVNTVIHTTLVSLEPATFRSLIRRATSSATEPCHITSQQCSRVYGSCMTLSNKQFVKVRGNASATRSLHKVSAQGHCTRSLHKVTAQGHCTRSLHKVTAQGHCTRSLHKVTAQGHCTRSLLYSVKDD